MGPDGTRQNRGANGSKLSQTVPNLAKPGQMGKNRGKSSETGTKQPNRQNRAKKSKTGHTGSPLICFFRSQIPRPLALCLILYPSYLYPLIPYTLSLNTYHLSLTLITLIPYLLFFSLFHRLDYMVWN